MTEQTALEMLDLERLPQQRIIPEIEHAGSEIVAGAPVGIDLVKLLGRERRLDAEVSDGLVAGRSMAGSSYG